MTTAAICVLKVHWTMLHGELTAPKFELDC